MSIIYSNRMVIKVILNFQYNRRCYWLYIRYICVSVYLICMFVYTITRRKTNRFRHMYTHFLRLNTFCLKKYLTCFGNKKTIVPIAFTQAFFGIKWAKNTLFKKCCVVSTSMMPVNLWFLSLKRLNIFKCIYNVPRRVCE